MISVILLLGGNKGSVTETFAGVKADLERKVGRIDACSEQLVSEAWGFAADDFLNEAVMISTDLSPEALLDATQSIENKWGRARCCEKSEKEESGSVYASRTIDIDIIFYGQLVLQSERLTIPHPLLPKRRFALEPIMQIASQWNHPQLGKSVEQMLNELNSL